MDYLMLPLLCFVFIMVGRKVFYNIWFERIRQSETSINFRVILIFLLPWMPVLIKACSAEEKKMKRNANSSLLLAYLIPLVVIILIAVIKHAQQKL